MGCGASKKSKVDAGFTATRGGRKPPLAELRAQHLPSPAEKHDPDAAAPGKKFLRSGASLKRVIEQNSVLVVARVRPLNQREGKSAVCVEVTSATSLTIAEGKDGAGTADRQFTFDACFRSDASQEDVYSRSGRMVLGKVLDGFNGCVFAYGQTGSGKTFTMQGSKEEPGIIPRICAELFERIATLSEKRYAVEIAMCEIYNEKLNDLLVSGGDGSRDLAIREEAGGRGVFVEGLSSYAVGSASEIQAMIDAGQKRRAVGRTNMNEHSSRSHSYGEAMLCNSTTVCASHLLAPEVITLKVTSCDASDSERVTEVECKLHLIDLAGSERQKATGATGDRLKEGAQINLSLSALGNVINALTDQKKKGGHVPYRDSKLTRLLSDSLGGNSVTVMLCNVSPAQLNAEETLSALRFAERAKKLENTATVARDSKAAKAAALFAENKALKERVAQLEAYVAALEQLY